MYKSILIFSKKIKKQIIPEGGENIENIKKSGWKYWKHLKIHIYFKAAQSIFANKYMCCMTQNSCNSYI